MSPTKDFGCREKGGGVRPTCTGLLGNFTIFFENSLDNFRVLRGFTKSAPSPNRATIKPRKADYTMKYMHEN